MAILITCTGAKEHRGVSLKDIRVAAKIAGGMIGQEKYHLLPANQGKAALSVKAALFAEASCHCNIGRLMLMAATALVGLAVVPVRADAASTSEVIERLPRAQRPAAYERAIAEKGISNQERAGLICAFAKHAKDLSAAYGKDRFPYDEQKWIAILRQGFEADPRDPDIACALAQLLIDRRDVKAALPVVKAFQAAHPDNHSAQAWLAWCESRQTPPANRKPDEAPAFPIHFCVLTRNPKAHQAATLEQCRKECDILNATFRNLDGKPLVQFKFKGYTSYQQIKNSRSDLLAFGDRTDEYNTDLVAKAFNGTKDSLLRDPQAINFYIYDSRSTNAGVSDMTSHGKRNSNRPFVLIDWQRLNGAVQNAEAHEMGHAFGLEHTGVPGATANTSTNIMASAGEQFGSGGKRDLGFSPSQAAIVLYHAQRTHDRLRAAR